MQHERVADLVEVLTRARALADGLEAADVAVEVAKRPSFLVATPGNDPQPIIERLAGARQLTFVVGAGVSMEAGLPSWAALVRALMDAAAPASLDEIDRQAWLDAAAESGLLGMAATAQALAGSDEAFLERIERYLYRGKGPDHFNPGPIAREIAAWKRSYPEVQLATFNYDRLLERALTDVGLTAEARQDGAEERDDLAFVRHLHGLLTRDPAHDAVVLTEADYAMWPTGCWQDTFMRNALDGLCVFLGLSFTDQNLLRWIYGSTGNQHVAVLARQSSPRLSPDVRRELELATRARLRHANVTAYWADFYAEVAQLMHEARRRRGPGRPPQAYAKRAQRRVLRARKRCLPAAGLEARQRRVREILSGSLAGVRAALKAVGIDPAGAVLGLGLWGIDYDQRDVTLWAASDRVYADASTIQGVPLAWDSEWVAVEAITQGSVVELDPDTYASRWRSVRGIPLIWTASDQSERVIVGAATLTTTTPSGSSIFDQAETHAPGTLRTIDLALQDQLVSMWD
jgi:SIR2-like domain